MDYANRALRLSPFDLLVSVGRTAQGIASVQEQRYDDAANYHELSVQANPTLSSFHFFSACAHALARKLEAARALARFSKFLACVHKDDLRARIEGRR